MARHRWLLLQDFSEKYEIGKDNVTSFRFKSKGDIDSWYKTEGRGKTYVDELYFIRRHDFLTRVWNECHDMYYEITSHISQADLVRILVRYTGKSETQWSTYLSSDMWSPIYQRTILNCKIPPTMWEFWRLARGMVRHIIRKENELEYKLPKIVYIQRVKQRPYLEFSNKGKGKYKRRAA